MTLEEAKKLKIGSFIITKDKTYCVLGSHCSMFFFLHVVELISGEIDCLLSPGPIKPLSSQIIEKHCT